MVALVTACAAILCAWFNLSELLVNWTRSYERYQLDELPGVLLVLAVCLSWFSMRRYREVRRQIVQRRRVEASLATALGENRRLAQQYLQIQESERKALARDLHDELGQYLNVVKVDAVSMRDRLATRDPASYQTACEIIRNLDHVQSVVIGLIRQLRPVGLDELGLAAALEHCVHEWQRRLPQLSIDLSVTEQLDGLDEMRRLVIYRLVQEALTNVARHSRATRVSISITNEHTDANIESRIAVCVVDNGAGAAASRSGTGLGLIGMRERIEAVGGSLTVESTASGFALRAQLPAGTRNDGAR